MFDNPYLFVKVNIDHTSLPDPIKRVNYRFSARNRQYFVTLEYFSFKIIAVKFRDNKEKRSKKAYTRIFNDYDAFRVITTCLHIMFREWKDNPETSFAFYATPRKMNEDVPQIISNSAKKTKEYQRARFNIYDYAMINLFPKTKFNHIRDKTNSLYVLLNKKHKKPKTSIKLMSAYLLQNNDMIFEPGD